MLVYQMLVSLTVAVKFLVINDIHLNIASTSYQIPMPGSETTVDLL
jgi:hypothetical protein